MDAVRPPPRFLLGAAVLFWAAITEHPVFGVLLALIIESARWVRLRWDFNDTAYIRAWQISVLSSGAMAVFIWLDGDRYNALPRLFGWLPVLFLPVQFTQSFGLRNSIPVATFSFFARQRHQRNLRLGLKESMLRLNFGNAYLIACMVASTLGKHADTAFFLTGLVALTGWALLAMGKVRRAPLTAALVLATCFAIGGQFGLSYLYDRAIRLRSSSGGDGLRDPNVVETAIGALGEIKLSPELQWRMRPIGNDPLPRLMRIAGYNKYSLGVWKNDKPGGAAKEADFTDLKTLELVRGDSYYLLRGDADQTAIRKTLPRFALRGAASSYSQLPVPGDAASVQGFDLDGIDRNSLGTVRLFPKSSVIDGIVLWRNGTVPEEPPDANDLHIMKSEQPALQAIAAELRLAEEPTIQGKIEILDNWFRKNFRYTRYLSIPSPKGKNNAGTAMSTFLTTTRRGHCEYFATAATLLLREVGVPARYAIGFAVMERDPKRGEFVLRGEHGHSWCRVWDAKANTWLDFDATPPGWLAAEKRRASSTQWLSDAFVRFRQDFFLWRNRPRNRIAASVVMISIGLIAMGIIGRRLWRSKHVLAEDRKLGKTSGPLFRTPLHDLETLAKSILGPRPPGLPFSRWLLGLRSSIARPDQLDEAIKLHQSLRFDPAPNDEPPIERLNELVIAISGSVALSSKRKAKL